MDTLERMASKIQELERRIADLETHERSRTWWNLPTEDLELLDAGSVGATEQDWIEVVVGSYITGYIRVFSAK